MKIEAKGFGRGPGADLRDKCGRILFVAENEVDAVQLAALYNGWVHGEGPVKEMRREVLQQYCRENNVTIRLTDA